MMVRASHDVLQSCDGHVREKHKNCLNESWIRILAISSRLEGIKIMEFVYILGNSGSLNRKLEAPRSARDEKRRATHNEGNNNSFN